MQLSYRGVSYNHKPKAVLRNAKGHGKYRGANWNSDNNRVVVDLADAHLTYRGVDYR